MTGTATERADPAAFEPARFKDWFAARGWKIQRFQREVWRELARGTSGLLQAGTGEGKTLAVWLGALLRLRALDARLTVPHRARGHRLRILWITPMRALAADTRRALQEPLESLAPDLSVGLRTGDTASAERARQDRAMPFALVTTPESLSLLISRADARERLGSVAVVVVDEWHELLGSKRGVQVQLALARIATLAGANPVVWGLSATLANPGQALGALLGARSGDARVVRAASRRKLRIDTLLPGSVERFPWAGHLGARMRDAVAAQIEASASALVFCNTRAQAELWYSMLLDARPDWAGLIALHHGSLDVDVRRWVESGLAEGRLRCVVSTSSLDLGVDFSPVERVLQVGSPKGVARLMQRAGRSGHRPGAQSRLTLVPTHALELVEAAAAQDAVGAGAIEPRLAPDAPMDVLLQHLVTVATGEGFEAAEMLAEVRSTAAYRDLTDEAWRWALTFVTDGGSLASYPEYRKLRKDEDGRYRVVDARIARRHRMSIGTIVADAAMEVRFMNGARLGTVEEGFVARLKPGDRFLFAGRALELARVHEMTAWVRKTTGQVGVVPRWNGGRMPLSAELSRAVLSRLDQAAQGRFDGPEMQLVRPLLELQARWSHLPGSASLLVERLVSREGHHCFVYPFAGRHANLGIACLIAWRAARRRAGTVSIAVNDYGFELLGSAPPDAGLLDEAGVFAAEIEPGELLAAVNAAELSRRRFREIARVAGLVFQGHPGEKRSTRSLQASASMFHDVFARHDPDNPLLAQARDEVLQHELDANRVTQALRELGKRRIDRVELARCSPFALPLMVERLRERLTSERLADRIARFVAELERAAR
mgnify:CR=1 FL=1